MSKVKWVLHTNLTAHELQYANGSPMSKQIPVIPLADLGELVEGLQCAEYALSHTESDQLFVLNVVRNILSQLEAHTNGVGDE